MYARLLTFKSKPGVRREAEALADKMFVLMKSLKGFISVHFMVAEAEDRYGSLSLWETRQDAEAAGEIIRDKSSGSLGKIALEAPAREIFEVYKPKA